MILAIDTKDLSDWVYNEGFLKNVSFEALKEKAAQMLNRIDPYILGFSSKVDEKKSFVVICIVKTIVTKIISLVKRVYFFVKRCIFFRSVAMWKERYNYVKTLSETPLILGSTQTVKEIFLQRLRDSLTEEIGTFIYNEIIPQKFLVSIKFNKEEFTLYFRNELVGDIPERGGKDPHPVEGSSMYVKKMVKGTLTKGKIEFDRGKIAIEKTHWRISFSFDFIGLSLNEANTPFLHVYLGDTSFSGQFKVFLMAANLRSNGYKVNDDYSASQETSYDLLKQLLSGIEYKKLEK